MTRTVKLEELPDIVEDEFEALHRALGYELAARIIDNAPVDSGRLKGSVEVSKNRTKMGKIEADPSGSATKRKNERNVKQATAQDDLYGEVRVPYGKAVDEGTSTTPPTGFFSSVVTNIKAAVDEAKRKQERFKS